MKDYSTTVIQFLLGVCTLVPAALPAETNNPNAVIARRSDVHFARSAPYASPAEAIRRLGLKSGGKGYTLATEKFQIIVPGTFSTNVSWGLLVWISPGETPGIPAAWEAELAKQQLLLVGAYKSGNQRDVADRARLAVEAAFNMRQLYKIDPSRIYVAGFSGGGRVAGMVGMGYADVFTGTICVCGVSFYTDIPTPTGEHWPRSFNPDASLLAQARSSRRFVLLTGDLDINRENTHEVWQKGFQHEGFQHVHYLEVPGLKHTLPSAEVLGTALDFVAGKEAH
jgi:predicted esterase